MRDHIKLLGILNIVMGSLTALVGLVILLAMGAVGGIITASIRSTSGGENGPAGEFVAPMVVAIGFGVALFFLLLAAPSIVGGWGLYRFKPWSRIPMIIVSGFHLLHVPLGTALGVYGFWVLFNEQSQRVLETGGAGAPPAYSGQAVGSQPGYPPPQPPPGI